jgi:RimJ/RimL family protein N-acetyltransferase
MRLPPEQLDTARLVLRRWRTHDAVLLADAIQASASELRRWTPWVIADAPANAVLEKRLTQFSEQFDAGQNFIYGIFDRERTRVLGQVGLYGRVGPNALEVGYFIRTDAAGKGYASEAAAALCLAAFESCGVERVEIRCDPKNTASNAIPRRLGFRVREVQDADPLFPGEPTRRLQIWEMLSSEDFRGSLCASQAARPAGPVQ